MENMENIKVIYRKILRMRMNKHNINRLIVNIDDPVSIISSNCIGGVILHELGLRFNTPTINLWFDPASYLKLISNLKYYCQADINEIPIDERHSYPRGIIEDDIIIHFLHYDSFSSAYNKWRERCKRINYNNLVFILTERDRLSLHQMIEFDQMNLNGKKLLLMCRERREIHCAYNMSVHGGGYIDEQTGQMIDLCKYKGKFTGKRYIDDFDYVDFLNQRENAR